MVLAVLLASMACEAVAQTPRVLEPLDEEEEPSAAFAINRHGEIVGHSGFKPVMWDREGVPIALPLLEGHIEGQAYAINARGEVAGSTAEVVERNVVTHAVLWDHERIPTALEPPEGFAECEARGINDRREVAGFCWDDDSAHTAAVRWDRKARPTALPLLEVATDCIAYALNNRGKVAGACGSRAVVWSSGKKAKVQALLPLEGIEDVVSEAFAINNHGKVVGYISGSNVTTTAVVWDRKGRPTALPPFDDGDDVADDTEARAVNDRGEVAGATIRAGVEAHATVWNRKGVPTALPDADEETDSSRAHGINNHGQIVGTNTIFLSFAVLWDR